MQEGVGPQPDDLDLVTRTILSEAHNQGPIGQAAVAAVIKNRTIKNKMTPGDVVLERNQFEPFNGGASNRNDPMKWNDASPEYARAKQIAMDIFAGRMRDPTNGATHFANVGTVLGRNGGTVGNHGWINPANTTARIGGHTFFAPEGRVNGYNQEMTTKFWANPSGDSSGTDPVKPFGGVEGATGPAGLQNTPNLPAQGAQPAGQQSPTSSNPSMAFMQGLTKGGSPQGSVQGNPPFLSRLLFGDNGPNGLSGLLKQAIPTPGGGQGLLGGMFGGAPGATPAAAGAPMTLPGVAGGAPVAAAAPPAMAGLSSAAAPAAAGATAAAAPAAAGATAGIGTLLSSIMGML